MTHAPPPRRSARPGAMTHAMNAARADHPGPKVLRVGVMRGTAMVAERVLRERGAVTVGTTEQNTFTVAAEGLPASVEVFSATAGGYALRLAEGMSGQVALPAGIRNLDELRREGATVALPESSRGRVTIGGVTLLFQFVAAPPALPRPQLPAAIRAGWVKGIDWTYNGCLSAFLALAVAGIGYVEYGYDPIVDDVFSLDDARLVRLMAVAPEVEPEPEPAAEPSAPGAEASAAPTPSHRPATPRPPSNPSNRPDPERDGNRAVAAADRAVAAALSGLNASAEFAPLTGLANGPNSARDVLANNGALMTGTERDLANNVGVTGARDQTGVRRAAMASANGPGGRSLGDGSLLNPTGDQINSGPTEIRERVVATHPRVDPGELEPGPGDGEVDATAVARVLRRELGGIRACYERELRNNPTLSGRLSVSFTLGSSGRALNASTSGLAAAPAVGTCVASRVRGLVFPIPTGGTADFTFPFTFDPGN